MRNLIQTDELAASLSAPDLLILDASWYLPAAGRDARREYEAAHIPRAIFLDIDAVSDHGSALPHMLPDARSFEKMARAMGLRRDHRVVVYDGAGIFSAPRVWWMLKTMGVDDVAVLDGGLPKWLREGRPTESGVTQLPEGDFKAALDIDRVTTLDVVRKLVDGRNGQIVDARPAARFSGASPEPRPGVASGHIPTSRNVPFDVLISADGTLKAEGDLRRAFEGAGLDLARPITTSCGSGVTAAVLYLGLTELGAQNLALYDGSWSEWGSDPTTPKQTTAA